MKKIHLVTFKHHNQGMNKTKLENHVSKHAANAVSKGLAKCPNIKSDLPNLPSVFIIEDAENALLDELRKDPDVVAVTEDILYKPDMAQSTEWSHGSNFMVINDYRTRGYTGAGVKVGIIDSGCANHEDLVWAGRYNAYTAVYGGTTPASADFLGHGTAVAGIIAAKNNSVGYQGVAPDVSLYGVKVDANNGKGGFNSSAIIKGVEWLVSQGVKIINCSFSGDLYDPALEAAFRNAHDIHNVLFICSAGNKRAEESNPNDSVGYPARHDFVVAVAALRPSKEPAYYSSRGPEVDCAAPADSVMTTRPSENNKNGTNFNEVSTLYTSFNGTSCAAPHVTGIAALNRQADPSLTLPADLRASFEITAERLGTGTKNADFGYGMVKSPWTTHPNYPGKLTTNAITLPETGITESVSNGLGKFFKFVPTKSTRYTFKTTSSLNLYMRLYDADYNQLSQDDDSAGSGNPSITHFLSAGQTYYVKVSGYSGSQNGSYSINVIATEQIIREDFEDTVFTIPFTGDWYRWAFPVGVNDSASFRSKASLGHGQTSQTSFKVTVPSGRTAKLSFYYMTASDVNDKFYATVNGTVIVTASGTNNNLTKHEHTLSAGTHTVVFKFVRDASGDGGSNLALVDDVEIIGNGCTVSAG
ncbi:S8 family serine peptidase [Brevibacillus borstelensis]|uniref:Peptidase S8/S53 subtilisin kexin sedolisin n=2 Tax=Brevibacillus borstelensis TaxID=45462 RepID=M8D9S0_9BACL|nr:S8 family serine peptidase [Brevibacillus borstelensis]EMT50093.1 peptidase S8/S53 subtilisin kexin sedolisin [Brevibacillus borstelensis AK1]